MRPLPLPAVSQMYSLLLCAAIALLFAATGMLLGFWGWGWAIVFGLVVFVASWILLARFLARRLYPAMAQVQKQAEAGMPQAALQSLRDLLPLSRWVPLLRGQLLAQMGVIAYRLGREDEGIELLGKASPRVADAQLLLASIHYRKGDKQRAFEILKVATLFNKKHSLLHNAYAWLLQREGKDTEALAVLAKFTLKQKADVASNENLLRLQNKKGVAMAGYGMNWYALELERPPASYGQVQPARKGFRTPPKRRGK